MDSPTAGAVRSATRISSTLESIAGCEGSNAGLHHYGEKYDELAGDASKYSDRRVMSGVRTDYRRSCRRTRALCADRNSERPNAVPCGSGTFDHSWPRRISSASRTRRKHRRAQVSLDPSTGAAGGLRAVRRDAAGRSDDSIFNETRGGGGVLAGIPAGLDAQSELIQVLEAPDRTCDKFRFSDPALEGRSTARRVCRPPLGARSFASRTRSWLESSTPLATPARGDPVGNAVKARTGPGGDRSITGCNNYR